MQQNSLANTLYDGAAEVGQTMSLLKLGGAILIGIILFCIASFFFSLYQKIINSTAIITDAQCGKAITTNINTNTTSPNQTQITVNCVLSIKYKDTNNNEYNEKITTNSSLNYNTNQIIDITYDKSNPHNVRLKEFSSMYIGGIICCIGLCIIICGSVNYWLVSSSKTYAAISGATTGIDMLKNTFSPNRKKGLFNL